MYTISKLSAPSQEFVAFLANGERPKSFAVSLAIAKVLANDAALPTSMLDDVQAYFRTMVQIDLTTKLSALNEYAILDTETILTYACKFFALRYSVLFPSKQIFCLKAETALEDFLGLSAMLDPACVFALKENFMLVTKVHNGVMTFLFNNSSVSNVRYQITQETCVFN